MATNRRRPDVITCFLVSDWSGGRMKASFREHGSDIHFSCLRRTSLSEKTDKGVRSKPFHTCREASAGPKPLGLLCVWRGWVFFLSYEKLQRPDNREGAMLAQIMTQQPWHVYMYVSEIFMLNRWLNSLLNPGFWVSFTPFSVFALMHHISAHQPVTCL